jgi:hypothetical protein
MKNKISTLILLSYLILLTNPASSLVLKNLGKTISLTNQDGVDLAATAKKCLGTLMEAIPADFCWKKGADFGVIPTGCPSGYFRSLALCYENCAANYRFVLGVCWQDCPSGYADHGLSCFKSLFSWYFKHSYIPSSLTNFSDKIPCPPGMYRSGALCYRDCNNIGLQNCGIGACATDGLTCGTKIAGMVFGVFEGIATAVSTVATLGGATAVKAGIKTGFKALGKSALNGVKNRMKKFFTTDLKSTIYNKAKEIILKAKAKEFSKEVASGIAPAIFCQGVWDESLIKISQDNVEVSENSLLKAVDVFDISGTVKKCSNVGADGGLSCATSVVNTISNFDPTGILTIAGAFMHPSCEVTTKDYRLSDAESQMLAAQSTTNSLTDCAKIDQNCVHLWSECNFKGQYFKACGDQDLSLFNDITKSAYVGYENDVTFFQHMSYNGRFLSFGPGTTIKCFEDYADQVDLTNIISSVKFNSSHCYLINFRIGMNTYAEGSNNFLCYLENPKESIVIREDSAVDNKLIVIKTSINGAKLTLYEEENYLGKSVQIQGSITYENRAALGISKIGSYKISTD